MKARRPPGFPEFSRIVFSRKAATDFWWDTPPHCRDGGNCAASAQALVFPAIIRGFGYVEARCARSAVFFLGYVPRGGPFCSQMSTIRKASPRRRHVSLSTKKIPAFSQFLNRSAYAEGGKYAVHAPFGIAYPEWQLWPFRPQGLGSQSLRDHFALWS